MKDYHYQFALFLLFVLVLMVMFFWGGNTRQSAIEKYCLNYDHFYIGQNPYFCYPSVRMTP